MKRRDFFKRFAGFTALGLFPGLFKNKQSKMDKLKDSYLKGYGESIEAGNEQFESYLNRASWREPYGWSCRCDITPQIIDNFNRALS